MFWVCASAVTVHVHPYTWVVCVGGWEGVTGVVVVTGLFIVYLPSDWLEDRPQVHLDQLELTCRRAALALSHCDTVQQEKKQKNITETN